VSESRSGKLRKRLGKVKTDPDAGKTPISIEEFAYFLGRLKSVPEGNGTLLDRCAVLLVHEHAEANDHKNNGLSVILAGHAKGLKTGLHTRTTGTTGDLYLTLANDVMGAGLERFPTAERKLTEILA
jgi:hypothetical protein